MIIKYFNMVRTTGVDCHEDLLSSGLYCNHFVKKKKLEVFATIKYLA